MIPEFGFNPRNLLINGAMGVAQRLPVAGSLLVTNLGVGYGVDRWRGIAARTDALALDNGMSQEWFNTVKPDGGKGSFLFERSSGGPDTNFVRFEQRVEAKFIGNIAESKGTIYGEFLRHPSLADLNIRIRFGVKVAASEDVHVDLLDTDDFDVVLDPIKVGGVSNGELLSGQISTSQFERFYATFDLPTGAENGLAISYHFVNDAGNPLPNQDTMYLSNLGFSLGGVLHPFREAGENRPDEELRLCRRYFEVVEPGHFTWVPDATNGTIGVGQNAFFEQKRVLPSTDSAIAITNPNGGGGFTTSSVSVSTSGCPLIVTVGAMIADRHYDNVNPMLFSAEL